MKSKPQSKPWNLSWVLPKPQAEFQRLVRRREAGEQFQTRAMREREAMSATGRRVTTSTIRVRFPEAVCLQVCQGQRWCGSAGVWGGGAWVCLTDNLHTGLT